MELWQPYNPNPFGLLVGDCPKDEENSAGKHEKPPDGDPYKELKAEIGCNAEEPLI